MTFIHAGTCSKTLAFVVLTIGLQTPTRDARADEPATGSASTPAQQQTATDAGKQPGPLDFFDRFVGGSWTIGGQKMGGQVLNGRTVYEWGIGRTYVKARTYVYPNNVESCIAEGVYAWDSQSKSLRALAFGHLGEWIELKSTLAGNLWKSEFKSHGVDYYQEIEYLDPERYVWRLYSVGKEGDRKLQIETTFQRDWTYVPNPPTEAAAAGTKTTDFKRWNDGEVTVTSFDMPEKRQDFEIILPASVCKVWDTLTTADGIKAFFPGVSPVIDMTPGGAYEVFPGSNCRVLAFIPREMLAVTGSAPPQFPTVRKGGTWGAYYFQSLGESRTRLRLTVVGWKQGDEWDQAYDYFLKNNPVYLKHLHKHLSQASAAVAPAQPANAGTVADGKENARQTATD